jgi:diguanylate cyclase (GGDEF)-like protein
VDGWTIDMGVMSGLAVFRPGAGRVLWGALLAAFAVYLSLLAAGMGVGDDLAARLVGDWLLIAIQAGGVAAAVVGALRAERGRPVWWVIAAALVMWTAAQLIWVLAYRDMPAPPYPSVSDGLWLGCYPLYYVALTLLLRDRVRGLPASMWLDGLIGALALASFVAALLFTPLRATAGGDAATVATTLAYPIGDAVMLALIAAAFVICGGRPGRAWTVLALGMSFNVAADWAYLLQAAAGSYQEGTLLDGIWVAAFLCLAAAAWQPARAARPARLDGGAALAAPLTLGAAVLGLLAYDGMRDTNLVAYGLAIAALAGLLVRLALTVRENHALHATRRQALTDELTGLANRRHLLARLERDLADRRATERQLALLLLDLDRFKEVNDTLGHHVGDRLLEELAVRLRHELRDGDLIARLGGDEFAVLLRPGSDEAAAARVAGRLLAALERDIVLDGVSIQVDGSIGIALAPGHAADASGLLQRADIAMYDAKRADLRWQLYDAARDRHARDRLALTGDLRRALGTDQLVLHYQPQADLASGQITGVEALVRWQHPTRGLLGPCQFIPLAEENGLMRPLTLHVLGSALRQARAWRDIGLRLRVAINISAHNLLDRELPNDVRALLDEHDLDPAALQLEITESAVMADPARAADVLSRLRELGVSVALDDFGTGHASLARLRHLAVDELKIDRSFVNDLAHPATPQSCARSSTSPTASTSASSPKASKTRTHGPRSPTCAATTPRATTSPVRSTPTPSPAGSPIANQPRARSPRPSRHTDAKPEHAPTRQGPALAPPAFASSRTAVDDMSSTRQSDAKATATADAQDNQRAPATGNLTLVRAAAAELPRIGVRVFAA